jgi:DNA-binding response OmpR family regulator
MGHKALVVDDDPAINSMLSDILELEGFEVTVVEEGSQAVDILRSRPFDAVVLDIMLPGRNGIEIMRDIRDAAETRAVPVVMLTAKADDDTTWAGWRAGCDYYMTKPFDPSELVSVLRRLCARS